MATLVVESRGSKTQHEQDRNFLHHNKILEKGLLLSSMQDGFRLYEKTNTAIKAALDVCDVPGEAGEGTGVCTRGKKAKKRRKKKSKGKKNLPKRKVAEESVTLSPKLQVAKKSEVGSSNESDALLQSIASSEVYIENLQHILEAKESIVNTNLVATVGEEKEKK